MSPTTITAVYENGLLRPLTPLTLPEHSQVQLQVLPISGEESPAEHRHRVHDILVAAGISLPRSTTVVMPPLTPEQRAELALRLATARPTSDLIHEEREEADERLLRR